METRELVELLIFVIVLVIVIGIVLWLVKGKGISILEAVRNLFRFGG